jgi:hypothetical protein
LYWSRTLNEDENGLPNHVTGWLVIYYGQIEILCILDSGWTCSIIILESNCKMDFFR